MPRNLSAPTNPLRRLFSLDQSQDYFRALADRLEEAVLMLSADGRQILTCNHALLLISGYSRSDIESLPPSELFGGEPGGRVLTNVLETRPGTDTTASDVPIRTRTGDTMMLDLRATVVGKSGSPILITARPSNWRVQAEEDREARLDRLATLAQISSAVLDGDLSTLQDALNSARKTLRADALGLYRISPTSPDYVLDGEMPSGFPPLLKLSEIRSHQKTELWTLGERPASELQKAARASGFSLLASATVGAPTAKVGMLVAGWQSAESVPSDAEELLEVLANLCHGTVQISLQQTTVAELSRSLEKALSDVRGQLDAVTDAVLALDSEFRVVRINQRAEQLLGYDQAEVIGQDVQDVLVGPADISSTLLDAAGHMRVSERTSITIHNRDGSPFPVHLRAVPVASDTPGEILIVLSDQSERQAIEDQNELLAQRALLGEVSAIFAHEVRNPINNISTGIQLVASRLGEDHPLYESLDRVRKECTRLDQLMSDVLFFTRRLELKMEPMDLGELVSRLLERWKPRLSQANVHTHLSIPDDLPRVMLDPRTFEQVVVNLISNALQAMPEGGTLSISLEPATADLGRMLELKIADTGPGIPEEQIDRIFDPFFTTKKDGTGLGLAISRRILSAHKGGMTVESFPGAGTVFRVRLPLAQAGEEDLE